MFVFIWSFSSHSIIFHLFGDVTIAGEWLQMLTYARHLRPLSSEGSLACHAFCDTWLYNSYLRGPVKHIPNAERLTVEQLLPVLTTKICSRLEFEHRLRGERWNPLCHQRGPHWLLTIFHGLTQRTPTVQSDHQLIMFNIWLPKCLRTNLKSANFTRFSVQQSGRLKWSFLIACCPSPVNFFYKVFTFSHSSPESQGLREQMKRHSIFQEGIIQSSSLYNHTIKINAKLSFLTIILNDMGMPQLHKLTQRRVFQNVLKCHFFKQKKKCWLQPPDYWI